MSRRVLWLPVVALVLLAAVWGYRLGQVPGETELINRYAARYVAETGGTLTDCVAQPDPRETVRMVVECIPREGDPVRYFVGPRGAEVVTVIGDEET